MVILQNRFNIPQMINDLGCYDLHLNELQEDWGRVWTHCNGDNSYCEEGPGQQNKTSKGGALTNFQVIVWLHLLNSFTGTRWVWSVEESSWVPTEDENLGDRGSARHGWRDSEENCWAHVGKTEGDQCLSLFFLISVEGAGWPDCEQIDAQA